MSPLPASNRTPDQGSLPSGLEASSPPGWVPHLTAWGLAVLLLLAVWWFALDRIEADRSATRAAAEHDLADQSLVAQEHALRVMQGAEQVLSLLQAGYAEQGERLKLERLMSPGFFSKETAHFLGVANADGSVRLSSAAVPGRMYVGDSEYFRAHQAADSRQLFISRPFFDQMTSKWSIALSRRLNAPDGAFAGVVFVSFDAGYFARFYADLQPERSGVISLVRRDGVTLVRKVGDGREAYAVEIASSPLFDLLRAGQQAGFFAMTSLADGVRRIYHFRTVGTYPLVVTAGLAEEDVMAQHGKGRESFLWSAALASLLILALGMGFSLYESHHRSRLLWSAGALKVGSEMPPRTKAAGLLMATLLVLSPPVLAWLVFALNAPQVERDAYTNLEAVAAMKVEAIEAWKKERLGDAITLLRNPNFVADILLKEQGDPVGRERLLRRLESLRDVYGYVNVQILDVRGNLRFSLAEHRHTPAQTLALLPAALAERRPLFSSLFVDAEDGEHHLDVVVPLFLERQGHNEPIGAAVLQSDPHHYLFPYIQRWPTGSLSGEAMLVRRDGDAVRFLNPLRHSKESVADFRLPLTEADSPAVRAVLDGNSGRVAGVDYRGVAVLAVYRPVSGTDWQLVSKLDRDEVYAPLRRHVQWIGLIALAAGGGMLAVLVLLWRQQERARQFEAQTSRLLKYFYELPFIGMAITSPQSRRWLQFNDRLCEIVGYSRNELLDKTWAEMTHPDDLSRDLAEFERLLRGETEGYELDKRFIRKDGTVVNTELAVRCVRKKNGSVDYVVATVQDISERTRAEQELRRSNSELEQFSYSISHDMRQPLRMISSYLKLLEMSLAGNLDEEKREYFAFAIDGAKRLDRMLVGLLEYSRVGRKGEPPAWVESRALLDEALLFLQPAISEANAQVTVDGEWPRLYVSPDEFLRLLQNLLANAIKFRVAGRLPEIGVRGELRNQSWLLTVTDNGIGVLPDQAGRLFQVFQRLQSRADYDGTGIGLALCRKIVERHGGLIWVESEGEGKGCRFYVELPLTGEENAPEHEEQAE